MSLQPEKQKRYERFVDATNALMAEVGAFFDEPRFDRPGEAELAHVVLKTREKLEEAFLYFNKGANLLHMRTDAAVNAAIDQAIKDAGGADKLKVVDTPAREEVI